MSDPCSSSDGIAFVPPRVLATAPVRWANVGCFVLGSCWLGILSARLSRFHLALLLLTEMWCGVDHEVPVVFRDPCTRSRVLGLTNHGGALDISDAENRVATRPWPPMPSEKCVLRNVRTTAVRVLAGSLYGSWSCPCGVGEECYLVDPASSHMLVSKIKPCMSKYKPLIQVKLRMAH